ncbi:hypothetical protein [Burkholderia seminalis]|uniref:hypothetical protein n=1 Tax=Burkholderia seminalis TaxID=488731 RepID=UPI001CF468E0|nr:hypothetical protein [Burkholderia seminalis]MCA8306788.1 hypothetical protein [Burkholderia seminalis]MCA8435241.1 hypothetical protein [Burkholderia seminalis]
MPLAGRGDEGGDQPGAGGVRLARVAAEFEVLAGQLGEIQSFQIATEEGEVLQPDPALRGRVAACGARARLSARSRRRRAAPRRWQLAEVDIEHIWIVGGRHRWLRENTETVLFDTCPAAQRRPLAFDFVGRPMK